MNFLVDAHLPPSLCNLLQAAGHDAIHTISLPAHNQTVDEVLNKISFEQQRVLVTKDSDFYHSHLLHGKPWKLLLVCTGNIGRRELTELFGKYTPQIITALEQNSLVELDRQAIRIVM